MSRRARLLTLLPLLATACGGWEPTQEEIDAARLRVEQAASAMSRARAAMELLGVMPVYECGEPRRTFVGRATESVHAQVACITATSEPVDASTDAVVLTFSEAGCSVRGHGVSGQVRFLYSGGESRMELSADLRGLRVDGHALQAQVGYGTCGDESSAWVRVEGALPGKPGHSLLVDAHMAKRDGLPWVGSTELRLDGVGALSGPEGTDSVTVTGLLYELGDLAPKEGEVLVESAEGSRVRATFRPGLWRLGKMELVIDDSDPVTVPIVQ